MKGAAGPEARAAEGPRPLPALGTRAAASAASGLGAKPPSCSGAPALGSGARLCPPASSTGQTHPISPSAPSPQNPWGTIVVSQEQAGGPPPPASPAPGPLHSLPGAAQSAQLGLSVTPPSLPRSPGTPSGWEAHPPLCSHGPSARVGCRKEGLPPGRGGVLRSSPPTYTRCSHRSRRDMREAVGLTCPAVHTLLLQLWEEAQKGVQQVLGHHAGELVLVHVGLQGQGGGRAQRAWGWAGRGRGAGSAGAEGAGCAHGGAAHSEEVVEALGVPTKLGQVVDEAVALLVGEQVHQVAGVHP